MCNRPHEYDAPSARGEGAYRVVITGLSESCNCGDWIHRRRRRNERCKHIAAVFYWAERGVFPLPCQWSELTGPPVARDAAGEPVCPNCGGPALMIDEPDDD